MVRKGLVDSERAENDAGHHGEVEVRVGVPRQRVALATLGSLDQASFGDQGDHVEVEPPQRGGQTDPERGCDDDGCGEIDVGAGTERHDGLAESDDDHEVVPFGKVSRHQPPDREPPSTPPPQSSRIAAIQRAACTPPSTNDAPTSSPMTTAVLIAKARTQRRMAGSSAADDPVEGDVARAHHAVGDGEAEGAVTERLRNTERDDEQTGHRDEHHEANPAFLGLDQAREPRVADPRPPDHRQREQSAPDSRPVRLRPPSARCTG